MTTSETACRSLASVAVSAILLYSQPALSTDQHADAVVAPQLSQATDDSSKIDQVRKAIVRNHLTSLKSQCLLFDVDSNDPDATFVDVRERHGGQCGGDPSVEPRLFTIRIDRKTGKMSTDARSDTGEFKPLED